MNTLENPNLAGPRSVIYPQPRPTIRNWHDSEKPIYKLSEKGSDSLTDAELLSIILCDGSKDQNVLELSRAILSKCENDLNALARLSITDLKNIPGVTDLKAKTIVAALEIGRRRKAGIIEGKIIRQSTELAEVMQPILGDLTHEEFHVIFLSRSHKLLGMKKISSGGMTGTVADSRIIFREALACKGCVSVILCHNHPSGNQQPSDADIRLTRRLVQAGDAIEIKVLDHLIVTTDNYYSFADNGIL